ncbi:hypothetical protein [Sutterella wadsworthensis]|uniref:hypothetical protein n=1 Tax=Sutterella wadsworthensis TaxID=40545 RepID=UPI003A8E3BC5
MKAVLISIRPKWCKKIVLGEKTIEVRKTRPKMETPFKCYIYCTNGETVRTPPRAYCKNIDGSIVYKQEIMNGKVIGEFTCDQIYEIQKRGIPENFDYCYLSLDEWGNDDIEAEIKAISASCVSKKELNAYGASKPVLYGWHISNLKLYDEPKKLSEFWRDCPEFSELSTNCWNCENVRGDGDETDCDTDGRLYLCRPPQSWGYVEELPPGRWLRI